MTAARSPAPFRTRSLQCPRCKVTHLGEGLIGHCERCRGSWVPEEALHDRVSSMQQAPANLRWHHETRATLRCVVCEAEMETLSLFDVPVDRCLAHGVWFDADELASVLLQSLQPPPQPQPQPVESGLTGAAADLVDVVAHIPPAIEATAGVVEVVLDVLGGIFSAIDF